MDTQTISNSATLETNYDGRKYINRDLSWLEFNYRVLMEARDSSLPVFERIKFLAIFSSNLDEFFRVRVSSIQEVSRLKKKKQKKLGLQPQVLLEKIYARVNEQQEEFGAIFRTEILPELEKNGICLLQEAPTEPIHLDYLDNFFYEEILPFLHPEILLKEKVLHFLGEKAIYFMVKLERKSVKESSQEENQRKKPRYALIQIPVHYFSRFVELPPINGLHYILFLDDVVRLNLSKVFPGFTVRGCHSIKMSRNADLLLEDQIRGNLASKIKESLNNRKIGAPARLLYDKEMPEDMLKYLLDSLNLPLRVDLPDKFRRSLKVRKSDAIAGGRYHNFNDFFGFPNPKAPLLEATPLPPQVYTGFQSDTSLFTQIKNQDHILHFPYHAYDSVIRFLQEASIDPNVEEIHTTQYRVASDSGFVSNLIAAALNNKRVNVFVELKARFDEATNLKTAEKMIQAGVNVKYSLPKLKVHAKIALVVRKEGNDRRMYAFLSTGNFNEKTAKIYADHGFFTADPAITQELLQVFNFLENGSKEVNFQQLLVAQFNIRDDFERMINREIQMAKAGKTAYMLIKVNNLEDRRMIDKLYEASQAGVKVDLIVRGICCLRPEIAGLSENIRIRRVVGTWLEHARVFVFYNQGAYDMYMGSADWMERNLSRRVEVIFPLKNPNLKAEVMHILHLQLTDNTKAVFLDQNLNNSPIPPDPDKPICAQLDTYELIRQGQLGKRDNLFP
ncbi:MAG: polyphosphate kinase 1 [Bacteroidota bacterium]